MCLLNDFFLIRKWFQHNLYSWNSKMFCYCFASNSSHYLKKKQSKTCPPRVQNIYVEYKAFSHPTDYLHSALFIYLYTRAHHKDICEYALATITKHKAKHKIANQSNPKGNQPWLFIWRTEAEAEAPIFDHLTWRANSLQMTLMLGKIESRRRRGQLRMRWLDGITNSMDMSLSKLQETVKRRVCCSPWGHKELDTT